MRHGTVYQRHSRSCPRDGAGGWLPHRCRGAWAYVVDNGRDPNGRRKQISKGGFPTRSAALSALREITDLQHLEVNAHTLTVGEYLDSWLVGKLALKPSTKAHYADAVRLYLRPHLGELQLLELRAYHLDRMYAAISVGVSGRPLKATSLRRVHACLSSALNSAVKRRLIPYNPALHVELPPLEPHRPTPWTAEQCRTFLQSSRADRLAAMYHLVLVTGLRRGEVVGLRWQDVDLDRGFLHVVQQITDVRGRRTVGTPKTKRGSRVIPLDPATVRLLADHRAAQAAERDAWGEAWADTGLVFTREDGAVLRPESVLDHFRELTRAAGLPVIRLHDLRHTNATLALEAGIGIKVVSERLGHSTTAITQDIYTHVTPTVGREAALLIAALLEEPAAQSVTESEDADVSALLAQEAESGPEGIDYGE